MMTEQFHPLEKIKELADLLKWFHEMYYPHDKGVMRNREKEWLALDTVRGIIYKYTRDEWRREIGECTQKLHHKGCNHLKSEPIV